ncbi:MAG: SBBP repeat-containing protein [Bryobacteraceae bacterium]|jgi:uncharacterized protein (TIGR03437 family)
MTIIARSFVSVIALLAFSLAAARAQQSNISYIPLNACCIAPDGQGNNFIVSSSAFPLETFANTPTAQATTITVVKMDASSRQLSTFTFPAGNDGQAAAAAVDSQGNLWIVGSVAPSTQSSPIVGLIAKLDSTGTQLLYSGTLGGQDPSGDTAISAIAFDQAGNAYLAGSTNQSDFPTTPGAFITAIQVTLPAETDPFYGFVAKLTPAYSLSYSTLLGGQQAPTFASALAVDAGGLATVAGVTSAPDFPATPGAFQTELPVGDSAVFVTQLNAKGSALVWSTLLGASAQAYSVGGMALDSGGNVVLAGDTSDPNFPVTPGAIQPSFAQPQNGAPSAGDGFVAKLSSTGASLLFSTYYGIASFSGLTGGSFFVSYPYLLGSNFAVPRLKLDTQGDIWITESLADPSGLALHPGSVTVGDGVIAEFAPDGSSLLFSELVPNGVAGQDLALNPDGSLTVIGPPRGVLFDASVSTGFVLRQPRATPTGVSILGVADAAAPAANNAVAPGEFVSVYGAGLGPAAGAGTQFEPDGSVATSLAGTQVSFNGVPAPLLYVSANQINLLVPYEVAGSTQVNMTITTGAGSSQVLPLQIVAAQPNIFAVLNANGSFNSAVNPASPGDTVTIIASGAGLLDPQLPDGAISPSPAPVPAAAIQVNFSFVIFEGFGATTGVVTATPAYAGAIPGTVINLLRVSLPVPAALVAAGPPPFGITLTAGNATSPQVPFYVNPN